MIRNIHFAAAAFAAIAAIACSKDDTADPQSGTPAKTPFTITAAFDEQPQPRVAMNDDGTKIELKWKQGDKIHVTVEGSTTAYALTAANVSQDGKTAEFTDLTGTFPEGATPEYALHRNDTSFSTINPASITIPTLPRLGSASSLPLFYPLYARYDTQTRSLSFKPLLAVLKLNVTLPQEAVGKLDKLTIASADGSAIFYRDHYDITQEPAARTTASLADHIAPSSHGANYVSAGQSFSLYLPIRPGTELSGKTLEMAMTVGKFAYRTTIKGGNLQAGKCYPLTRTADKWTGGAVYEGGSGTETDPYQIKTVENLRALATATEAQTYYSGMYFRLENDIEGIVTCEAEPWRSIGNANSLFRGNFDGNNHTVSGTFHLTDNNDFSFGLFYYAHSISNLTLRGDVIYKSNRAGTGNIYIGGIAADIYESMVNCHHIGALTIENPVWSGRVYAGGIAGSSLTITGCTQSGGTITATLPTANMAFVGGICGSLLNSKLMHTCRSESDIAVTASTGYVGALAGQNFGTIYDCSTFLPTLSILVNGTPRNPVTAIGNGNGVQPCDDATHAAQP